MRLRALFIAFIMTSLTVAAAPVSAAQSSRGDLTNKIRRELLTLPFYGVFDNLAFRIDGNTVTLLGNVVRPTTRSDAERRVARLAGVDRVINRIQVLPLSPSDDRIRINTYRAVSRQGSLYRYFMGANPSIRIIVNRGHITLEGVVSNPMDSQLAYMAARGVPGAFSVRNNLRVDRGRPY